MNYRTLRYIDTKVSELCFGTMRYADKNGAENDRSRAGAAGLNAAIEQGVNFIHSSYEYGTRWLTGAVLKNHPRRHELQHIIKVNVPDWSEPRFDPQSFRRQVEDGLRDLHTERILVVQHLHRGVTSAEINGATADQKRLAEFAAMESELGPIVEALRQEGKIGAVMSFPYTTAYARRALESPVYNGLVAYFNPLEMEMYPFFARLAELQKDFISIRPLAGGIMTSARIKREALDPADRMHDAKFDDSYRLLAQIRALVKPEPASWQQFAFQFSLAHAVIKSSVLGINSVAHLEASSGETAVDPALLARIVGNLAAAS